MSASPTITPSVPVLTNSALSLVWQEALRFGTTDFQAKYFSELCWYWQKKHTSIDSMGALLDVPYPRTELFKDTYVPYPIFGVASFLVNNVATRARIHEEYRQEGSVVTSSYSVQNEETGEVDTDVITTTYIPSPAYYIVPTLVMPDIEGKKSANIPLVFPSFDLLTNMHPFIIWWDQYVPFDDLLVLASGMEKFGAALKKDGKAYYMGASKRLIQSALRA